MKINKVMIAGVDDNTSIKDLEHLKKEFPFVEWGVLFTHNKPGRSRYPSEEWISEFVGSNTGDMSAHFCGDYARKILEKGDLRDVGELYVSFSSLQLNYNFKARLGKWTFDHLNHFFNYCQKAEFFPLAPIFQNNEANNPVLPMMIRWECVRILHDASGGRGKEMTEIKKPYWDNYTGFAGGINPGNVESIMQKIQAVESDRTVWIDLESGVRDENDEFSIDKCRELLEISAKYIG